MGFLNKRFRKQKAQEEKPDTVKTSLLNEHLMISQYAAHYVYQHSDPHKEYYFKELSRLGFTQKEAEKLFAFECEVLKSFNKNYLLSPQFTKMWFFGLRQPFFLNNPKEKDDILKVCFFTLSELCKIIDEAEWHYWNSHEKPLSESVWGEIYAWRLRGEGGSFAIKYFEMVAKKTGIPMDKIGAYSNHEGDHLNKYKWG